MRSEAVIIFAEKAQRVMVGEHSKVALGEALASSISTYWNLDKEMFPQEHEKLANICLRFIMLTYNSGAIINEDQEAKLEELNNKLQLW